ncbi:MAG: sigma 54-interacting transcriptional regulator [Deltaproteobacteria bacterium]|nr:sigma 54-interacting transcriptional regulator [Deltaproteobacteria bacterium]
MRSLKTRLLLAVSGLVIASGLLISLIVTQRYSSSLFEALTAQGENLAHAIALEVADKVLINDLVALQKTLDHQQRSNRTIGYLFVVKDGQILAHTFPKGFPKQLIGANQPLQTEGHSTQEIGSTEGQRYLDIAWPIFEGKGGVLRLGLSEKPYRQHVKSLWLQMSVVTLTVLLLALIGTLLFIKRMTSPLITLAQATREIDEGALGVRVEVRGGEEVTQLAKSFNHMISRIEDYTQRLEKQTLELEHVYQQTRTSCSIVKEIGSLRGLSEISVFLVKRLGNILKCDEMVLLAFSRRTEVLFILSSTGINVLKDPEAVQQIQARVEQCVEDNSGPREIILGPPFVPETFQGASAQAVIPFKHEKEIVGALVVACPSNCQCDGKEIDAVQLIMAQAAGVIRRAVLHEEELRELVSRLDTSSTGYAGIIGKAHNMQVIFKLIEDIAPTDATVLIEGESGTGKELVAKAIHNKSPRKDKSFVIINCSAYPETLLESELFGHEKGAFTGAVRQQPGRFEQADGGTVFLDEIGEISPSAQIKLLRVLQSQTFERLGGQKTLSVDVRVLAATNKNLLQEVQGGRFREDLYYRLNVIPIQMPPLRERPNDIPLLARYFLRRFAAEQCKEITDFSSEAMRVLFDYSWSGNVRELENSVEHAVVLTKGRYVEVSDLPGAVQKGSAQAAVAPSHQRRGSLAENERELLQQVLEECSWNKKEAARRLGISRNTLYVKLKKYEIVQPSTH